MSAASRDLVRTASSRNTRAAVAREERLALRDIREIQCDTAVAEAEITAIVEVTRCAFTKALEMDDDRQRLACGDPATSALLTPIEATGIAQIQRVQRDFRNW